MDTRLGKISKTSRSSLLQEALALPKRSFWMLLQKLDLLPVDSLLVLLSESPILVGDCGLHSCFHWTWFSALSKQHFPPCAPTPPLLVPTIYSHGLTLKPPNTSPRQLLTLRQFCQRHLSRSKSDHTNGLLQTLPQLLNSSGIQPRCLVSCTKTFSLCSPGLPLSPSPAFFSMLCPLSTISTSTDRQCFLYFPKLCRTPAGHTSVDGSDG